MVSANTMRDKLYLIDASPRREPGTHPNDRAGKPNRGHLLVRDPSRRPKRPGVGPATPRDRERVEAGGWVSALAASFAIGGI
jgi:hypothetical protein